MRFGRQRAPSIAVLLVGATAAFWPAAAKADRADIEKRATQRLQITKACQYKTAWTDSGSGADRDLAVYRPQPPEGYFIVGSYAVDSHDTSSLGCVVAVRPDAGNVDGGRVLVAPPSDWRMVWADRGSGADQDGSFWQAIAPEGFVCLGNVARPDYNKPGLENYRCVNACVVEKISADEVIWSDRGSGAERQVSLYRLPNVGSFVGRPGRDPSAPAADLKSSLACAPTAAEKAAARDVLAAEAKHAARTKVAAKPKTKAKPRPKPADQLVKSVQGELNRLGYPTGTPDGRMGPKTRNAIVAFQLDQGLASSGRATASLLEHLAATAPKPRKTTPPPKSSTPEVTAVAPPPPKSPKPEVTAVAPPAAAPKDDEAPMTVRQPPPGLAGLADSLMRDIETQIDKPPPAKPPKAAAAPKATVALPNASVALPKAELRAQLKAKVQEPSSTRTVASPAASGEQRVADTNTVIAIQALLSQLNFDAGPPTGQMSAKTTSAIIAFQSIQGMVPDGQPTMALRDQLIASLQAAKTAKAAPPRTVVAPTGNSAAPDPVAAPSPAKQPTPVPEPKPAPMPEPKPAPQPVPSIGIASDRLAPNEKIIVEFENLPAQGQNWISLAAANHKPDQYYDLQMLEGQPVSGEHGFEGLPKGEYLVRLYLNWPDNGYEIADEAKVVVAAAPPVKSPPVKSPPVETAPTKSIPAQDASGTSVSGLTAAAVYFSGLACGDKEKAKLAKKEAVYCRTPVKDMPNAPHDGNTYKCVDDSGKAIRMDNSYYFSKKTNALGMSNEVYLNHCTTDNALIRSLYSGATKAPKCDTWKGSKMSKQQWDHWRERAYSTYQCIVKGKPVLAVPITPTHSEMAVCETGRITYHAQGNLAYCRLAGPVLVPGPFEGMVKCAKGNLYLHSDGRLRECRIAPGSSTPVVLPDGQKAVCAGGVVRRRLIDLDRYGQVGGYHLERCDVFEAPVKAASAAHSDLRCSGIKVVLEKDAYFLNRCVTKDVGRFPLRSKKPRSCGMENAIRLEFGRDGKLYKKGVSPCKIDRS